MQILINNISMPIKHRPEDVLSAAQEIARHSSVSATNFRIYKQSLDARRKNNIHYVYSVVADADRLDREYKNIKPLSLKDDLTVPVKSIGGTRPVVVGMGPAGLFAAYILAKSGNPPLLIDRGGAVDERIRKIDSFWSGGKLDKNTNVQFGEGGAGTFSDGKLNTGISDPYCRFVLKTFADFGAPDDILYKAKPHIGTDMLRKVIVNMRNKLIEMGVEIKFNTRLTDLKIYGGKVSEIELNKSESVSCEKLILALGHSARDTFKTLWRRGVYIEPKPFAAGVRIEHKQSFINDMQYKNLNLPLPPADYKLVYNGKDRSCYSFCMCPGGQVVNASSEEGRLVVNGMSEHLRDGKNANSALVVNVSPDDFDDGTPFGGVEFQRKYESLAFKLGGSDYTAPVQLAKDFVKNTASSAPSDLIPSFTGKIKYTDLRKCLPDFISKTLTEGLNDFERRISGFVSCGSVLTGIETRTSSPVRMTRKENGESVSVGGIYPSGEGAGYAGGITSAAVDGIRTAMKIINGEQL